MNWKMALAIFLCGVMTASAQAQQNPPEGYTWFLCQPNGIGETPEKAERDLKTRILPYYQRVYGDKPGFTIFADVAIVHMGRNLYQADGRCGWYVPRVKTSDPRAVGRKMQSGAK